jgi:hypothetical protein
MKKNLRELERYADTISRLASKDMSPKQLIDAVRKKHPDASKREITRAAFFAVIKSAEDTPDRTFDLHNLAMDARNNADNEG